MAASYSLNGNVVSLKSQDVSAQLNATELNCALECKRGGSMAQYVVHIGRQGCCVSETEASAATRHPSQSATKIIGLAGCGVQRARLAGANGGKALSLRWRCCLAAANWSYSSG